ncbi:hypothetical protein GALMADRAFT_232241 [Galerina marginata CBS 339.88]|uniref:Uncharacterized protein n=1 Tax=Galerina marginata (strain CBS 339.88) TaxID=685588 RepID=A0A067S880_GALM3|nr:hypothetical protein GALMADRAFT_232241 [Galerina marginata CBS 339.88]
MHPHPPTPAPPATPPRRQHKLHRALPAVLALALAPPLPAFAPSQTRLALPLRLVALDAEVDVTSSFAREMELSRSLQLQRVRRVPENARSPLLPDQC